MAPPDGRSGGPEGSDRAALLRRLRERAMRAAAAEAIPRRPRGEPIPLSFAQERLFFVDQLSPGDPAYNLSLALRLRGDLDARALELSLGRLVARHETLRTTFAPIDGIVRQIVAPPAPVELARIDPRGDPAGAARREADRPFDLAHGPLFRASLIGISTRDHLLVLSMHHAVSDGWSIGVLVSDLAAFYAGQLAGDVAPPADLPIQYGDFALWQRARLESGALETQRRYWTERLRGAPAEIAIPLDRTRRAAAAAPAATVAFEIDPGAIETIRRLAREEKTTLFAALLAIYQAILHRWSGQDDICVGVPTAGRVHPLTEDLVGLFVNTLVMRSSASGDPTFREFLRRTGSAVLAAHECAEWPFERVVADLRPDRAFGRTPFAGAVFAFQNLPGAAVRLPGVEVSPFAIEGAAAKFDLALEIQEAERGVLGSLEYRSDLFDTATARRLTGWFSTLAIEVAADPARRISTIPFLADEERAQVLNAWNGDAPPTETAELVEGDLAGRFERVRRAAPDRVAVSCGSDALTYAALEARAEAIASTLRAEGVGPEVRVGLCVGRSLTIAAGVLGILKAGGAYVPMDPEYPAGRLRYLIEDSRARLILCDRSTRAAIPAGARAVILDDLAPPRDAHAAPGDPAPAPGRSDLPAADDPARAAYVIYTSGSTGKPKGVVVTHAHVLRLFRAAGPLFAFDADDVWTLFHSPAFDFSVWEMWGAWLSGGRVVIVPHEIARSPEAFHDLLARERVTVLNQTPSAFRQLARADEERRGGELALRWVIFGGERLEPSMLRGWCARRGDERPGLVNMYGITETTVHVTWRRVRSANTRDGTGSRIGRPLPDLRVYVLDAAGRPAPIGVPGEIHVGGAGVARGYLDRAGLTAERFVPDPFTRRPGARMYRSGDRGRWIDGGDLEYLGRLDHQVKVRGFRVECGEIESALAEHPGVRECAVVARDDDGEDRRLVAYVVAAGSKGGPGVDELRAHLGALLPEHMIPSAFVPVDRLPLTAHGKLDRAALPAPEGTRPALSVPYAPPRGRAEEILGEVWREALGLDRVGRDDNFFDLGGDSIRSIQVRSRARERGLAVSIPQMFGHQTLRGLAGVATRIDPSADAPAGPPPFGLVSAEDRARLPESAEDAYPLSRLQAGLRYHSERSEDYTVYLNSLHVRARYDARALADALHRLTARHPMLRTSIDLAGFSEPLQIVHRESEVVLALVDLRPLGTAAQEETIRRFIEGEMRRPFEWSRAPLFRFHVHLRTESSFQLTMSEPFLDGWSVATLLTELFTLYLGGAAEPASDPLRATYRDYVALEREAIASVDCRGYWERALALEERRKLPCAAPAGHSGPPRVLRIDLPIEPGVAEGLKRAAREAGVPIKSVLLAAQMKVLGHLTGARRPVTGLLANGRPETADGERIVGPFLNLVPFRVDLRGGSWLDLVRRAFDAEREMLPYRRYPMADLKRIAGGADLFDTVFNFTHFHIYRRLHALTGCEVVEATGNENTYFPLTTQANMDEETGALGLAFDFQSHVVDEGFVREAAACFTRAFESMARAPGEPHASISLLSPLQRAAATSGSTEIPRSGTAPRRLDEWFAGEASRRSDAAAVVSGADRLTYGELRRRAGAAAAGLRRLGVGRGSFVGLLLERSADLPVAALAVLEAGAAYVPLDPEYPRERLTWLIEDSRARVLVAGPGSRHLLPTTAAATQVVTLEELSSAAAGIAEVAGERSMHPDDAAYVIYTSGSTGVPKGVVVTHANVSSLMESAQARFGFGDDDVWTLFHSFSFDFSVWEMWGALLHGGRLVIAPHRVSRSPEEFLSLLERERVTVLNQTPSSFLQLMRAEAGRPRGDQALRWVIFGGEALDPAKLRPWVERHGDRSPRLVNMYGITETTVHVTWHDVRRAEVEAGGASAIGRPLDHLRAYVLDGEGQPTPPGAIGELWVGGSGVARGYLNRPELTAERFVPDPFAAASGARMYRSGDRARRRPEGDLEYLGRSDRQVKVRGFRVETGEIESALAGHPDVAASAVVAREDEADDRRLVAYFVPRAGGTVSGTVLRDFLKATLPAHMVPASFVPLDALPLTAHGKLDTRALPAPGPDRPHLAVAYAPPSDALEIRLAAMWRDVLRLDRIGVRDDFFELGGDSIRATQLVARLREALDTDIRVGALFDAPTIAQLAVRIRAAARPVPPARSDGSATAAERRAPSDRRIPLSFAQRRLWFLDRLEPGSGVYNVPAALRLRGSLDVSAFRRAFDGIVRRHEPLRTTFGEEAGEPFQIVHPAPDGDAPEPAAGVPRMDLVDLGALDPVRRETEALALAQEEARAPFDLERGPLARARLARLGDDEHLLLINFHHAVADGWSTGIFLDEMAGLYGALREGRSSPLVAPVSRFADHAAAQQRALESGALDAEIAWWREALAGAPALDLPADRPRPALPSFRGARVAVSIDPQIVSALRELGRTCGTTLFMTLLAAFETLLHRWSGQTDFCVGTAVSGRPRRQLEGTIGFFANTLPLRGDLSGDPPFTELLTRVRRGAIEAFERQEVPFERIVEELRPARDLSRQPLFQVMFAFQRAASAAPGFPGISATFLDLDPATSKFDLTLSLAESEGEVAGMLEYSTDLFDAATMRALAGQFGRLLPSIASTPSRRLSELALSTDEERQELVRAAATSWGVALNGGIGSGPWMPLHERLVDRARAIPDALAVAFRNERLTYRELEERSGILSERLRAMDAVRRSLVAVCSGRSVEMVVGILGTLRSGGAYVPIDPAWPEARIAAVLEDARPAVVLATSAATGRLPRRGPPIFVLDGPPASGGAREGRGTAVRPGDLAYVLYTSGSTGRPKGVEVTHAGLLHSTAARADVYREPVDRFVLVPSFAFDSSVAGIFWTLLDGGALIVAADDEVSDPPALARLIARHRASHFLGIPALYDALLEAASGGELDSLRTAIVAGEACPAELVVRHEARLPGSRLFNEYGPTEATVWSTVHEVRDRRPRARVSIGRPIPGARVHILDGRMEPAPFCVSGQIAVGGAGVARGYLNLPDRTAERFVPDPFADDGSRLYLTGDVGRRLPDGTIEFLGRRDGQVKIRGVRVEAEEVEAVLASHPAVAEAAVVARPAAAGEAILAAFVAPRDGERIEIADLRRFAAARLPAAMVPGVIVRGGPLPRTGTGKLDRRALAAMPVEADDATKGIPPRDPLERSLARIWSELLGIQQVGVLSSFFDLGGHSLLAVRLAARIEREIGVRLPIASFFQHDTIAALAASLRESESASGATARAFDGARSGASRSSPRIVELQPAGKTPPLWLAHGIGGDLMSYAPLVRRLGAGRRILGLESGALTGNGEVAPSLAEMAERYAREVRRAQPSGPYRLAGWSFGGVLALEIAGALSRGGAGEALVALVDAHAPTGESAKGGGDGSSPPGLLAPEMLAWPPDDTSRLQAEALFRGHLESLARHRPGTFRGRALLIRAAADGVEPEDPTLGWSSIAAGGLEIHDVAGDHFDLVREPAVRAVAELLRGWLDRADRAAR